jgi:DNA polymerase elongation subunit (family B)
MEPWLALRPVPEIEPLRGAHASRFLILFDSWLNFTRAVSAAEAAGESFFRFRSPVEQYLVLSGQTLFKGMTFEDVRRLQLDIETLGLDPSDPASEIITIALRTHSGQERFLVNEGSEAELFERLTTEIQALDPDVIEGHNIFNFDLPYLTERAARANVSLDWGRDGSALRVADKKQRFKALALSLPYRPASIAGRHIIDTYQQIQRWDVGGQLTSFALKPVMKQLFPDEEREVIPGEEVRAVWERGEISRLAAYNLADVRDVDRLSRLCLPTEFYQAQIVPRSFQSVATGGSGEKINDILIRAYVAHRHSLPKGEKPRPYPGGYTDLLATGVFRPVVKCDVESLYPSIMLTERIASSRDTLNVTLPILEDLTRRRLQAKRAARLGEPAQRVVNEGLQASFKVLINSFYGYLGYAGALFADFEAAERITITGQRIIKQVVTELDAEGATPIEVDTDGVYFVPPASVVTLADEEAFIQRISDRLPEGINLAHDGHYAGMASLKLKNYALLDASGRLTLHGSSLRSRQMERSFRQFIGTAAEAFVRDQADDAREAYFLLAEQIRTKQLPLSDITQWRMVNTETLHKQPRFQAVVQRLQLDTAAGTRLETYERQDGTLALAEEYANDENVPYLLRRLHESAQRFRPLFPTDNAFDAFFPRLHAQTDLDIAKSRRAVEQLSLF